MLQNAEVVDALAGYRLVRFDITASTAEQRALLDRYQLFGPPALMLFDAQGAEQNKQRVVGEIDAKGFLARLRDANDQK